MTAADPFDVVQLARTLIGVRTVGGHESDAVDIVAPLLEKAGMSVHRVPLSPGRDNLVATHNGGGDFILSGHLDTVPYDEGEWSSHPLEAHLSGDRLVGRGSSDMKAGVAAMICAAVRQAERGASGPGFTVLLSAGEETGCEGAAVLRSAGVLPADPILVIGEATANRVRLGHKGAVWFAAHARGIAAHGSRPELGRNAIEMLLPLAAAVSELVPDLVHPHLGQPTINLGTIAGGLQTNLVPDSASLTLDLRTVPGVDTDAVEVAIHGMVCHGRIERILDLPAIWTNEDDPVTEAINSIVASVTGELQPASGASYFTDAAVLAGNQPRAFIIGPGQDGQPHTVDEYCSITRIHQAVDLYENLLDAWQIGRINS